MREITAAQQETTIVEAVISLGSQPQVEGRRRGRESAGELAFLRTQLCDEAQGYLFGRPMPAHEFEKLLEASTSSDGPRALGFEAVHAGVRARENA